MQTESAHRDWVHVPRPIPRARARLFCFPFAGGGASAYRRWHAHLPEDVEVIAAQLPGREERLREPAISDARALTPMLAEVLAPYLDRPFALFGHSMGALLAFELARHLARTRGIEPLHLFVSAHCEPKKPHCLPPISALSTPELLAVIKRLGATSDSALADRELMELMLPLLRADLTLCERYSYQPGEKLSCPISALGGANDAFVRRADLLGWRDETRGSFQLRMFPGGHFFLHDAEPRVLQIVGEALANASGLELPSAGTRAIASSGLNDAQGRFAP